jgi:hypothetical protein
VADPAKVAPWNRIVADRDDRGPMIYFRKRPEIGQPVEMLFRDGATRFSRIVALEYPPNDELNLTIEGKRGNFILHMDRWCIGEPPGRPCNWEVGDPPAVEPPRPVSRERESQIQATHELADGLKAIIELLDRNLPDSLAKNRLLVGITSIGCECIFAMPLAEK